MTDMAEPEWGDGTENWEAAAPAVPQGPEIATFPAANASYGLANHAFTISIVPGKAPMIVVRGETGAEVNLRLAELENAGVYIQLAAAQQAAEGARPPAEYVQQQMGATMAQQFPTPQGYPAGPPVPSPGQPPFGAPQGGYAPPAPAWGGAQGPVAQRPAGWYAVKIPFAQKTQGDQVKDQLKAQGLYQGNVKWEGATKTWLVSPNVVQYFAQWNPLPA